MKEASEFLLDYLMDDGQGHLITGPSISPENRCKLADGAIEEIAAVENRVKGTTAGMDKRV